MSYRVRFRTLGGHVHAHFWSSEFGPETTHGHNGELVFRRGEDWEAFRRLLEFAANDRSTIAYVQFIDETPVEVTHPSVTEIIGDRQYETESDPYLWESGT